MSGLGTGGLLAPISPVTHTSSVPRSASRIVVMPRPRTCRIGPHAPIPDFGRRLRRIVGGTELVPHIAAEVIDRLGRSPHVGIGLLDPETAGQGQSGSL